LHYTHRAWMGWRNLSKESGRKVPPAHTQHVYSLGVMYRHIFLPGGMVVTQPNQDTLAVHGLEEQRVNL
jgi:hypothetical protein